MRPDSTITEGSMRSGEDRIPQLASAAGRAAHRRALDTAGWVVMKSVRGSLVKRDASGREVVIKELPKSTPSAVGTVLRRNKKKAAPSTNAAS